MALSKSIDGKNAVKGAIPAVSPWPFVRAAAVANLIVGTLVFFEAIAFAWSVRDGKVFAFALALIPFVTLVVWGSATVLYVVLLASRRLGTIARRLIGPARSSPSGRFGVWDDWLDMPDPQQP
jgi:hypothetical protein